MNTRTGVLFVVVLVAVAGLIASCCLNAAAIRASFRMYTRDPGEATETAAADAMRAIWTAQFAFQKLGFRDEDGDGVGDYGDLVDLGDPNGECAPLVTDALMFGNMPGYSIEVEVTPGAADAPPQFTCIARPWEDQTAARRAYRIDQDGLIRFTSDGSVPTMDSPVLQGV